MRDEKTIISSSGDSVETACEFADLPDCLRPYAMAVLAHLVGEHGDSVLSRAEMVSAIASASFRPMLEQEARLHKRRLSD